MGMISAAVMMAVEAEKPVEVRIRYAISMAGLFLVVAAPMFSESPQPEQSARLNTSPCLH